MRNGDLELRIALQRTDAAAGERLGETSNDRSETSGLFGPSSHHRSSVTACSFVPLANVR